ncbi:MAG: hypothetical protein KGI65_09700 [Acidobacteriota bacterium]|nr:hypothetical protein [Acidobacteriota bacterium]MDE3094322.1 hypothetical protein [Acidobacteriota bacterium]
MAGQGGRRRGDGFVGTVGWDLWNYSKRISEARNCALIATEHVESCRRATYWTPLDLAELEELSRQLVACARRAEDTWSALRAAQSESDADVVRDVDGIAVIQGGGSRPQLQARLRAIYAQGRVTEYWELMDGFKRLLSAVERRRNRERGAVIAAVIAQRRLSDNILWHETLWTSARLEERAFRFSERFDLSRADRSALRQLTVRLEDCANHARGARERVEQFLIEIQPGSSLWSPPPTLEAQILDIHARDASVEEARALSDELAALLSANEVR